MSKGIKHSFVRRMTWRIMLVLFVVIALFSYVIYAATEYVHDRITNVLYTEIAEDAKETVLGHLTNIQMLNMNSLEKVRTCLDRPDSLYPVIQDIVSRNPYIIGCGLAFEADRYPQKGKWFEPYALRGRDGQVVTMQLAGPEHDYSQLDCYKRAIATGEALWSDPYLRDAAQTDVCSYVQPVRDGDGRILGVYFFDLSLEWLKGELAKHDRQKNLESIFVDEADENVFYSVITDRHGSYLVRPDTSGALDAEGNDLMMFRRPVGSPDWTVALVVPRYYVRYVTNTLGIGLMALVIICLLAVFYTSRMAIRRLAQPMVSFAEATKEIARGHFDGPLPEVDSEDEIGLLHDSFANMQQSLTKYVADLKESTATQAAIEGELKIASEIQMSMLPKEFPPYPERSDIDIYGYMTPAKAVGGDLFDFFIRDEKLFFCIGDVSGKGIPASLFMTATVNLFNAIAARETMPDKIMQQMNATMIKRNDTFMFVTLFIGVLDLATGHLVYSNGGHDAPLLLTDSGVTQLPMEPAYPIGVMDEAEFEAVETDIAPGTTIFLYTDGLTEATSVQEQLFGDERLLTEAQKAIEAGHVSPRDFTEHIVEAVHTFVGDAEQSDDLTMLAIRKVI